MSINSSLVILAPISLSLAKRSWALSRCSLRSSSSEHLIFLSCLCKLVMTILGFLVISSTSASQTSCADLFFYSMSASGSATEIMTWDLTSPSFAKNLSILSSAFSTLSSFSSEANLGGDCGLMAVPSICFNKFLDSKNVSMVACHNGQLLPSVASLSTAHFLKG